MYAFDFLFGFRHQPPSLLTVTGWRKTRELSHILQVFRRIARMSHEEMARSNDLTFLVQNYLLGFDHFPFAFPIVALRRCSQLQLQIQNFNAVADAAYP
jgi:hypothetical protein